VSVDRVGQTSEPGIVLGQGGGSFAILLDLICDQIRTLPAALIVDEAHPSARGSVRGIVQNRKREMLEPLGSEPVSFAP